MIVGFSVANGPREYRPILDEMRTGKEPKPQMLTIQVTSREGGRLKLVALDAEAVSIPS